MKKIAIIIPAYKDTFLSSALESLVNQTRKDFTVYIGDDCSPNNLSAVVEAYSDRLDIVYHRFDDNIGGKDLVQQWSRCIDLSHEEPYIWLFSDDDIIQSRCVEEFVNLPQDIRDNYLVHFDVSIIDEFASGKQQDLNNYPTYLTAKEYLDKKLRGEISSFVVEFIFSRKLYDTANGFQNFDLAWGADFMTWIKFANSCRGIYTIPSKDETRILWRKSNQNISPNKSYPILIRKINALIENAVFIKTFLKNNGYNVSFKYVKFVWGEILRNKEYLKPGDIHKLGVIFREKVGYVVLSYLAEIYCKIK